MQDPPAAARARQARQTDASALHSFAVVHNEGARLLARAFGQVAADRTADEKDGLGSWDFGEVMRAHVHDGEEWVPVARRAPSGKWTVHGDRRLGAPGEGEEAASEAVAGPTG